MRTFSTPVSGASDPTGPLNFPRGYGGSSVLPDGRILVVGGSEAAVPAEIYDPASGTWSTTASPLATLNYATAAPLPQGRVETVSKVSTELR